MRLVVLESAWSYPRTRQSDTTRARQRKRTSVGNTKTLRVASLIDILQKAESWTKYRIQHRPEALSIKEYNRGKTQFFMMRKSVYRSCTEDDKGRTYLWMMVVVSLRNLLNTSGDRSRSFLLRSPVKATKIAVPDTLRFLCRKASRTLS